MREASTPGTENRDQDKLRSAVTEQEKNNVDAKVMLNKAVPVQDKRYGQL